MAENVDIYGNLLLLNFKKVHYQFKFPKCFANNFEIYLLICLKLFPKTPKNTKKVEKKEIL